MIDNGNGRENNIQHLVWLEWMIAFALIWIFLNHAAERVFGFPWITNPTADWPPLSDRVAQLAPLAGYGFSGIFMNIFRYVGWLGDQGVQIFIIVSGFGLTWGLLAKGFSKPLAVRDFYLRRLSRIYPLWWGAHLLFFAAWLFTGRGLAFTEINSWISFLGLRVTPATFYHFAPAWWYFVLILQLYLIYPFLWKWLQRWGALRFFLITSVIAFSIRAAGLLVLKDYLDVWQRGGIFITRLPEFVFGMSLAAVMFYNLQEVQKRLLSKKTLVTALLIYALGLVLSLDLLGMTVAPFLLGVGVFVVFYQLLARSLDKMPAGFVASGAWIGVHSYALYLVHHPAINRLIPQGASVSLGLGLRVAAAVVASLFLALFLEFGVSWGENILRRSLSARGAVKTGLRFAFIGFCLFLVLLGSEGLVRQFAPQEIFGWGERPSLEPNDEFGWRLIPEKTTRLRWQTYDYIVSANSLGFPGPEYPPEKPDGVYRILVTGDAFTSAEGVNTEEAWPRSLETGLREKTGKTVQVMNFAITGYGPNQYAAIIQKYVPIYQPDLVIVEMFVNDLDDVTLSNEQFQQSIGFDLPSQDGIYAYLRLEHLRSYLRYDILDPLFAKVFGNPSTKGYFLGYFYAFERDRQAELKQAGSIVEKRLEKIHQVASSSGSALVVLIVPASIQVCQPADLEYYPQSVDFTDAGLYDPDFPQELLSGIGQKLQITMIDLRSVLRNSEECPYQPGNMHWTGYGHRRVADYLQEYLFRMMKIGDLP